MKSTTYPEPIPPITHSNTYSLSSYTSSNPSRSAEHLPLSMQADQGSANSSTIRHLSREGKRQAKGLTVTTQKKHLGKKEGHEETGQVGHIGEVSRYQRPPQLIANSVELQKEQGWSGHQNVHMGQMQYPTGTPTYPYHQQAPKFTKKQTGENSLLAKTQKEGIAEHTWPKEEGSLGGLSFTHKLKEERNQLRQQFDQLRMQHSKYRQENSVLQVEQLLQKQKVAQNNTSHLQITDELVRLRQAVRRLEDQNRQLKYNDKNDRNREELEKLKMINLRLEEDNIRLRREKPQEGYEAIKEKIEKLEQENAMLRKERVQKEEYEQLRKNKQRLEEEIRKINNERPQEQFQKLKKNNQILQADIVHLASERPPKQDYEQQQQTVTRLENQLRSVSQRPPKQAFEQQRKIISRLEEQSRILKDEKQGLLMEKTTMNKTMQGLVSDLSSKNKEIDTLKKALEDKEKGFLSLQEQQSKRQGDIVTMQTRQLDQVAKSLQEANILLQQQKQKRSECEKQIDRLVAQNLRMATDMGHMGQQLSQKHQDVQFLNRQCFQLDNDLQLALKDIDGMRIVIQQQQDVLKGQQQQMGQKGINMMMVNDYRVKVDVLSEEIERLAVVNMELKGEYEVLFGKINHQHADSEELKRQVQMLDGRLDQILQRNDKGHKLTQSVEQKEIRPNQQTQEARENQQHQESKPNKQVQGTQPSEQAEHTQGARPNQEDGEVKSKPEPQDSVTTSIAQSEETKPDIVANAQSS